MDRSQAYRWARYRSRTSYHVRRGFASKVLAACAFAPALFAFITSTVNAATVAQFTGGEFYYDGSTFSTASSTSTAGVSSIDSITNPFGFAGSAPMTLNITSVATSGGWTVSGSGNTGEQLFSGGSFSLSDASGVLLAGTLGGSALSAATGSVQTGAIFNFTVVDYSSISANLNTGLSAPLPGGYAIALNFLDNYSTPTASTTGALSAFNATGSGSFSAVPIPPAAWLFSTGFLGLMSIARRKILS